MENLLEVPKLEVIPNKDNETLKEADASKVNFMNEFYSLNDGTKYSVYVDGDLPEGIERVEFGDNNSQSNPGTYDIAVTFIPKEGYKIVNAPETIELYIEADSNPGTSGSQEF